MSRQINGLPEDKSVPFITIITRTPCTRRLGRWRYSEGGKWCPVRGWKHLSARCPHPSSVQCPHPFRTHFLHPSSASTMLNSNFGINQEWIELPHVQRSIPRKSYNTVRRNTSISTVVRTPQQLLNPISILVCTRQDGDPMEILPETTWANPPFPLASRITWKGTIHTSLPL